MAELTSKGSPQDCMFGTKAGSESCKSDLAVSAGTSPLSPLIYVRYKDHVIYKNIQEPVAKAVERETVGWLTKQSDEIMLIEHDRTVCGLGSGINGIVILKSCVLEIRQLPLQKISNWHLNCQEDKGKGEFALQPKKRKTQPQPKKHEG